MRDLASLNKVTKISDIRQDPGGYIFINENKNSAIPERLRRKIKRLFDITAASFTLVFLFPLLVALSLLMLLLQGRPVFVACRRIGRGGHDFSCFKFRTMVADAQKALREHLERDPQAQREWQESQKLKNDPRVTPLGRILRRSSVDELPQLINVIRGDMSLVGPRPIIADEMVRYGAFIEYYMSVRPGLTGLWQVSGRGDVSYQQRVQLDVSYVREWSLGLDIKIILKTIPAVLKSTGSY